MRAFEYVVPQTVPEALSLLQEHGDGARPLAGGTDLLIFMQGGRIQPEYLVDLGRIDGLRGITYDDTGGARIGALTSLRDIERSPIICERYPGLAASTLELAGIQIRNMGTIGGNTCNASPAADTIPPLMALDATAVITGPSGERRTPYADFFHGPGRTDIQPGELLTAIELPPPPPRTGSHYIKLAVRRAMDIAIVGLAATVTLDNGSVKDCRITMGAVGPTVMRAHEAEEIIRGKTPDDAVLAEAAKAAQAAATPIDDQRASASYRKMMVVSLTRQAVQQAIALA